MSEKVKVAISYSSDDKNEMEIIKSKILDPMPDLTLWTDFDISSGEWDKQIKEKFKEADIILLLLSHSFFSSQYINGVELQIACTNHDRGDCDVVPIYLKHIEPEDVKHSLVRKLQGHPTNPIEFYNDPLTYKDKWISRVKKAIKIIVKNRKEKIIEGSKISDKQERSPVSVLPEIFISSTTSKYSKNFENAFFYLLGQYSHKSWPYKVITNSKIFKDHPRIDVEDPALEAIVYVLFIDCSTDIVSEQAKEYHRCKEKCQSNNYKLIVCLANDFDNEDLYKEVISDSKALNYLSLLQEENIQTNVIFDTIEECAEAFKNENSKQIDTEVKSAFIILGNEEEENTPAVQSVMKKFNDICDETDEEQQNYELLDIVLSTEGEEYAKKTMEHCEAGLIYYGNSPKNWLTYARSILLKLSHLRWKAIYVDDPNKGAKYERVNKYSGYKIIQDLEGLDKVFK